MYQTELVAGNIQVECNCLQLAAMLNGPIREVRCSYMLVTHRSSAQDWWLRWRLQTMIRGNRKTSWENGVTGKQPNNHQ